MPNKLTDNEIKKGFIICNGLGEEFYCSQCPYEYCDRCVRVVARDTLDLINRLEAENESLKAEVERLKAENSILMKYTLAENKTTATAIMAETKQHIMTAEKIKRLKEENERLKEVNDSFTDIGKLYSEIKAEAYKEFAERLKEKYLDDEKIVNMAWVNAIEHIDNLLNELVG